MILQRLVELYERRPDLPRPGFQDKEIAFIAELTREGLLAAMIDARDVEGKKVRGRRFTVPQEVKRTSGERANLLWDKPEYALGVPIDEAPTKGRGAAQAGRIPAPPTDEAVGRASRRKALFAHEVRWLLADAPGDDGLLALLRFLEGSDLQSVREAGSDDQWALLRMGTGNVGFRLQGEADLISSRPAVREVVARASSTGDGAQGQCLISGAAGPIARLHPAIKGVNGAQSSGANIVSFNLAAFESHGLKQGANAPVGEYATFAYTTALNALLERDSRHRARAASVTIVFWAGEETANEDTLLGFFGLVAGPESPRDLDPLQALYQSPASGRLPLLDDPTPFFILGLSAESKSRLTVRFFHQGTIAAAAGALARYFRELEIAGTDHWPRLFRLLCSLAVQGKPENIMPLLEAELLHAVFVGGRYPERLLAEALNRSTAEAGPTADRARLIKAFLIRNRHREVTVSLDPSNPDPAYRLGRLFAALERLQQAAIGPRATIRDRFYGAASATPGHVFPQLERLAMSHLGKLQGDKPGLAVFFERLLGEIHAGLSTHLPTRLSLDEQGAFAIGYWHERHRPRAAEEPEAAPDNRSEE